MRCLFHVHVTVGAPSVRLTRHGSMFKNQAQRLRHVDKNGVDYLKRIYQILFKSGNEVIEIEMANNHPCLSDTFGTQSTIAINRQHMLHVFKQ